MRDGALGGADRERETSLVLALVDNLPEMVAYWDADQRCRFANRAYETWFGVRPENLIGRQLRELLGSLYDLNLPFIEGALRGEEQQFEREIPDPKGGPARASLAHYVPDVVAGEVRGFCVVVTDITQRKRADAAKLALERQSRDAARLSGMAALAAGVGHELNNPLAVVLASIEHALENVRHGQLKDEATQKALGAAWDSATRMRDIVRSVTSLTEAIATDAVSDKVDWVESAEAEATRHDATRSVGPPRRDADATHLFSARRHLLIVDDEPAITSVLERVLGGAYSVTCANRGRDALELLDREFDVVLCDLMMPDMSGVDLHAAVSERRPELAERFVFMTGGAFSNRAREFLANGSLRVVEKPFDFDLLLRTLAKVGNP